MLDVPIFEPHELDQAATVFHRDGFVCIKDALTPEQLAFAQAGAQRIIDAQLAETELEKANRGFARYSFGDQTRHPEWSMLIDLPTLAPLIAHLWGSPNYTCAGAGGDYSVPGAEIQMLHSDLSEFLNDPLGQTTVTDLPTPFIVVNFLMVDFTKANGAIRFIPATQRFRHRPPILAAEPQWMQDSILCAPAGTAVVRDVRCWHAGTANTSDQIRPMTSVAYFAPWYRGALGEYSLPREVYETLSPRSRELCRLLVGE